MADYGFNTNLGPQQAQGMSLGDMINLARGAQAYQQSQQVNPLLLRQQAAQTKLAEETLQTEIEQKKATSESTKLKLNQEQTHTLYGLAGGVLNDPRLNSKNPSDVMGALYEAKQRASTFGIPAETVDGVFQPLMTAAQQRPQAVKQAISNIVQSRLTPESQQAMQLGGTVEINGVKYQYKPATGQLEPIGGGGAPAAVPGAAPSPAPAQRPASTGLVPLDMPVTGNVAQLNQQQQDRYNTGVALMKQSSDLAQAAGDSRQTIRQIQQNIGQAAGSKPEQIIRNAKKWAVGSEQLDELVKSLADNQMRQSQMMGAGTDAARDNVAKAYGTENITAGALKMITDRAEATNTAFEKFNKGLNSFRNKFGQYNGAIHADNFKRAWAENYDPLVFWVQNINASDMSKAEKQMEISKVLKGLSEEQRVGLAKKAENIKRLEKGDF